MEEVAYSRRGRRRNSRTAYHGHVDELARNWIVLNAGLVAELDTVVEGCALRERDLQAAAHTSRDCNEPDEGTCVAPVVVT